MNKFTPDNITELEPGQVFVFGSNTSGHHAGGAARLAYDKFGAKWGQAWGRQGMTYAIPTMGKDVTLETIQINVKGFLSYAQQYKDLTFLVTKIGCGIAGFKESHIKHFFKDAPPNVIKPEGW